MNPRKKELYMALVDFADKPEAKDRPVLVISSNKYNENHPDVVVCCMTTNFTHDCFLALDQKFLESGEVYPDSGIRYDTIQRIAKNRLRVKIGKITDEFHKNLSDKIIELIV